MVETQQEGWGEVVLYQTSDGKAALDVRAPCSGWRRHVRED